MVRGVVRVDDVRDLERGGDTQTDRADGDVDLAADQAVSADAAPISGSPAGDPPGISMLAPNALVPVPAPEVPEHAQAHAVESDDAQIDATADIDLECQRIDTRQPSGEDLEDLVERGATLINRRAPVGRG